MIPRLKPALNWQEIIKIFLPSRKNAVQKFEKAFAKQFSKRFALAFPYGRTGLMLLLEALGIQNKEIICPAYTCVVVAHAIVKSGNTPVFVDCKENDFNMDLDKVADIINENTAAIIATSIHGYPVNLDKIKAIKEKNPHIKIIQDCAHSFSASWKAQTVESLCDAAFYGLNISKLMTSVFGGMVVTDDKKLYERLRKLSKRKLSKAGFFKGLRRRIYLLCIYFAFNRWIYKLINWLERKRFLDYFVKYFDESTIDMPQDYLQAMSSFEAGIGMVQLSKYDAIIAKRRMIAAKYNEVFSKIDDLTLPPNVDGATYSHYVVQVENRKGFVREYLNKGLQLGILIEYSIPSLTAYSSSPSCIISEKLSKRVINIPIWYDIDYVNVISLLTKSRLKNNVIEI